MARICIGIPPAVAVIFAMYLLPYSQDTTGHEVRTLRVADRISVAAIEGVRAGSPCHLVPRSP